MKIGQIVFSKRGRDIGRAFVIMALEGEYVFLTDGNLRPLCKLKKKKAKHIQPTNKILDVYAQLPGGLKDADIRKWLLPYTRHNVETNLTKL